MRAHSPMHMRHQGRDEPERKILVVDDQEEICAFLKRVLAREGQRVAVSHGGPDAIDKLQKDSFDLVITDLKMPGVDGVGVLRKAKELDPLCQVIMITGYASMDSAVEVMKLGAYDYISKPFNLELIRFLVDRAFERRRLLQAARERDAYRRLSQLDGMTEVHNRRHFDELLSAEISRCSRFARPLSLLMIDLDDLKVINDSYGHQVGDRVLREVASTLKRSVRSCDIVARYGGDEFAIILVETSKMDAITAADRLRNLVAKPRYEGGTSGILADHPTTISIGVASYPSDARAMEELVTSADHALYAAKESGGNCVKPARP